MKIKPLSAPAHSAAAKADNSRGTTKADEAAAHPETGDNPTHCIPDVTDGAAASPCSTSIPASPSHASLYLIQPVHKLPSIDPTRTVAGLIAGRRHARLVDVWVVRVAVEHRMLWNVLSLVLVCVSPFLMFTETALTKSLVTAAVTLTFVPVLLIHGATLCSDMLLLLTQTFEFWFILVVNVVDNLVWISLFRGVRVLAMLVICAGCMLPMFLDANLHNRALVLRLLLTGAPSLMFSVTLVNLRLVADLNYTTVNWWGVTIDPVDVMTSGTGTVAFFMMAKAFRNRHIIFPPRQRQLTRSNAADDTILCEMFHPACRLVPYNEAVRRRPAVIIREPLGLGPYWLTNAQMELSDGDQLQVIDAGDTFMPTNLLHLRGSSRVQRTLVNLLNTIGTIGSCSLLGLSVWQFVLPGKPFPVSLILPTCLSTGLFVIVHIAHFQRTLFRSILFEVDAWFVSIQATIVSLGACDVLHWDQRSLLVGVAWVWVHWMISLDALTPIIRQHLKLSRVFILLVNGTLILCPMWLAYMLYFSQDKTELRNRVVFHIRIAGVEVRGEMLSFLASRIFTLWLWMGRFFWRESMRPVDAFKLIKHRVQFRVDRST